MYLVADDPAYAAWMNPGDPATVEIVAHDACFSEAMRDAQEAAADLLKTPHLNLISYDPVGPSGSPTSWRFVFTIAPG